ncbi:hypothetical protein M422DRAFT_266639 [Sphaerobolus stellatus SS14]|uniref:Unplaced genomic scaffold SPHSTscaffold_164, whole genome shotgun sequence n=1 Tax=Sphaerobolus stellatus (strain SS14) TaxID=990650 RepID=A0A0C9TNK4_SPHS4|nr:hypothetical protein M422DRAFT_266639 [Sphaerobolus stellatus SS14]
MSYLGLALPKIVLSSTTNPPQILLTLTRGSLLNIVVLLTDGITVAVSFIRTWGEHKSSSLLKDIRANGNKSLSVLLFQQGVIRFIIIFTWTLEGSVTEKVLNPNFAGVDLPLEDVISAIHITRFILQLKQERQYSSCTSPSKLCWVANIPRSPRRKLRATVCRLSEDVVEEFGAEDNTLIFVSHYPNEDSAQKAFGSSVHQGRPQHTRGYPAALRMQMSVTEHG